MQLSILGHRFLPRPLCVWTGMAPYPRSHPGPKATRSRHAVSDGAPARRTGSGGVEPQPRVHREDGRVHPGVARQGHPDHGRGRPPVGRGALVRKSRGGAITATDGPFTEAKEVIGGFGLINANDRAEAVEYARRYADLFGEVEVEVRQVVEFDDLAEFKA